MKITKGNIEQFPITEKPGRAAPFGQAGSPNVISETASQGSAPGFVEFTVEDAGKAVATLEDDGGKPRD